MARRSFSGYLRWVDETDFAPTRERAEFRGCGVQLAGELWRGQNPIGTAVLLHGGGQTRHSWSGTAEALARAGWTTLALDARGHGESQWAPDGTYGLDLYVEDLALVLQTLPERPVLIGASLGGLTALVAEGERGPLARALVLVDIVPRVQLAGVQRIHDFMTAHLDGFASLEEVARAVEAYNPTRKRRSDLEGLKKNVRLRADGRWYWHWDPALLTPSPGGRGLPVERMLHAARNVHVPTLVVRGGLSDVVSQEGVDELLAALPRGASVAVDAAGHMVAGDENTSFAQAIANYLAELPAG